MFGTLLSLPFTSVNLWLVICDCKRFCAYLYQNFPRPLARPDIRSESFRDGAPESPARRSAPAPARQTSQVSQQAAAKDSAKSTAKPVHVPQPSVQAHAPSSLTKKIEQPKITVSAAAQAQTEGALQQLQEKLDHSRNINRVYGSKMSASIDKALAAFHATPPNEEDFELAMAELMEVRDVLTGVLSADPKLVSLADEVDASGKLSEKAIHASSEHINSEPAKPVPIAEDKADINPTKQTTVLAFERDPLPARSPLLSRSPALPFPIESPKLARKLNVKKPSIFDDSDDDFP